MSQKSLILWLATVHCFGVIVTFFTLRPRPMARSFILFATVSAQTFSNLLLFLVKLPLSFYVVLWDGSASCFLRLVLLFVISRVRKEAELVITCHTQVHTLFLERLFATLIRVLVDCFVFATIFFGIRIAVIPALATFETASFGAFTFSEARSCFSPHKFFIIIFFLTITFIRVLFFFITLGSFSPLKPADSGAA